MFTKHIGIVISNLLAEAQKANATNHIQSLHVHCRNGATGPSAYGKLQYRGVIHASSGEEGAAALHRRTEREEQYRQAMEELKAEAKPTITLPAKWADASRDNVSETDKGWDTV